MLAVVSVIIVLIVSLRCSSYAWQKVLSNLDERRAGPSGNRAHVESVVEQMQVERTEEAAAAADAGPKDSPG